MVTARELKVRLSLTDEGFKRQMSSINRLVNTFDVRIRHSVEGVELLEEAMKDFDLQDKLPNKIELAPDVNSLRRNMRLVVAELNDDPMITTLFMRVNEGMLKESTEDWIGKLGRGINIRRLPLRVSEGVLKETTENWIGKQRRGTLLERLPLRINEQVLTDTINRFVSKVNKGRVGIDRIRMEAEIVEQRRADAVAGQESFSEKMLDQLMEINSKLSTGGKGIATMISEMMSQGVKVVFF